jgi:sporulation protein YlmC with PRC-barrel domain
MKKFTTLIAMTALTATFAAPGFALSPTSDIVMTDHSMRSSKLIGATVYNNQGQSIGSVIDVLVKGASVEPTVILSVGDFVGGGAKLVALPLSHVNLDGAKPMMAGATKQMLASMPAFLFKPIENNGQG